MFALLERRLWPSTDLDTLRPEAVRVSAGGVPTVRTAIAAWEPSVSTVATGTSAAEIRRRVDELLPTVRERAAEVEEARRLPADLVVALRATGVFGMPMPRSRGGPELTPREQVEIIERIAAAVPSVAWCAMIGSDGGYYSAFLDDDLGRHLWPEVNTISAGWVTPAGRARRDGSDYVVDGRWQFGSGCTRGRDRRRLRGVRRRPGAAAPGRPATRAHRRRTRRGVDDPRHLVHDRARGSGSHDYGVAGLRVPAAHTFTLFDPPRRAGPLYAFPRMFFANMSGVPLGLARGAIDTVLDIARDKIVLPEGTPPRDESRVRLAVARAEAAHGAARAYVYDALDRLWDELTSDGAASRAARVQLALSRAGRLPHGP